MLHPLHTPFFAMFRTEVLLNSKRVAPYVMALVCAGNGLLWWGWGPLVNRGVAVNSDFAISGVLPVYSFMTLPLFTAVIMADTIIRDFRAEIDPLIFSKPISRAEYLLGKFFGNFFVLACGQSAFVVTWFVLQFVSKQGVTTHGVTVIPYIKHFLVFVVISHLPLAAFYFMVGALTRNAKIVYLLGVAFYPIYIASQLNLKSWPIQWHRTLDPLLMTWGLEVHAASRTPAFVNQLVVHYDSVLYLNRVVMLVIAALLLTFLYRRFISAERPQKIHFSSLNLSTAVERISSEYAFQNNWVEQNYEVRRSLVTLPSVTRNGGGVRASFRKLVAALAIEFRLLLAERSLVVIGPLALLLSTMEVIFFWSVRPEGSYSAAYVSNIAGNLLLFMIGISIFYTAEALQRDRDLKIEPLVWSQPVSNFVLLFSKFLSTLLLVCALLSSAGLIAVATQALKQNGPVELTAYLRVYFWILIPNAIFLTAAAIFLKVLLRDRYLTYAVAVGIGAGLLYFYNTGHNGWLYNPLLFRLWEYQDLVGGNSLSRIMQHRLYVLILALVFVVLTHIFYQRVQYKWYR